MVAINFMSLLLPKIKMCCDLYIKEDSIFSSKDALKKHGVNVSYDEAWRARELALNLVRWSLESSYTLLPAFSKALIENNPSTYTTRNWSFSNAEEDVGRKVIGNSSFFRRLTLDVRQKDHSQCMEYCIGQGVGQKDQSMPRIVHWESRRQKDHSRCRNGASGKPRRNLQRINYGEHNRKNERGKKKGRDEPPCVLSPSLVVVALVAIRPCRRLPPCIKVFVSIEIGGKGGGGGYGSLFILNNFVVDLRWLSCSYVMCSYLLIECLFSMFTDIISYGRNNFLETDAMFLEFEDDLHNLAEGSSSVGDNAELERHVAVNGRISMTIAPGTEKPISSHVVRFSQAIGVCVRKTFPICCLKWVDDGREYIEVVKGDLQRFFVFDFNDQAVNRHFKKYSDPEEARANPPNEQSRTNKAARQKQLYNHSRGSKSFLQRQYELAEKKGESVNHMELFRKTHVRSRTFVLQAAEDTHTTRLFKRPGWGPKPKACKTTSASSSITIRLGHNKDHHMILSFADMRCKMARTSLVRRCMIFAMRHVEKVLLVFPTLYITDANVASA
uniref:CACTA en-spm transposon protein n=1 Tax=Cucumis melo TaxID=3656 RepID=A0A9I9EJM2_CUCME